MAGFNEQILRDGSGDPLVPAPIANEIIKYLPQQSAVAALARRFPMSTKTLSVPVLSVLPAAYWVTGDVGLKQTTRADWAGKLLTAEELAVLVPIPDAYIADSSFPIWDEVAPLITEAIGAALDGACLFGVDKPASFGTAIFDGAVVAGNIVVIGETDDLAADIALSAQKLAEKGVNTTGFASAPGFTWRLVGLRSADGVPIYQPSLQDAPGGRLYGQALNEVLNGSWVPADAVLLHGDWGRKAIYGVRQDITVTRHTDGVITDADGVVVFNAMQQDSTIYRVVFRAAWQVADAANRVAGKAAGGGATLTTRPFPFGVVTESTTYGS